MEEQEEKGMDTTYIGIMVVVFLAMVALIMDIGYIFVTDEDLKSAAETAALEGTKNIKQRLLTQIRNNPARLGEVAGDLVQPKAREVAIEAASGKHHALAVIGVNNNSDSVLAVGNDISIGFWDSDAKTYTAGATPANAMQVRTRRTVEHESTGLGKLGVILSKMTGTQTTDFTPDAIAAFPAMATAKIAVCTDFCASECRYPEICTIQPRKMVSTPWDPRSNSPASDRFAFTSLLQEPGVAGSFSDLICMDTPPQQVCGGEVHTTGGGDGRELRDVASMMYNPNIDASNKEYDAAGNVIGWWTIVPVTSCQMVSTPNRMEKHTVTRYAMVRIVKVCANGPPGCQQTGTSFKAPAGVCDGSGESLYIDRISCVDCGSKALRNFPGLKPLIVK